MKHGLSLGAAALLAALTFSAPASAQVSPSITGVGDARMQNQPSATGLASTEGRSGWHRGPGWNRGHGRGHHYGWSRGRHRGWYGHGPRRHHHRHWR